MKNNRKSTKIFCAVLVSLMLVFCALPAFAAPETDEPEVIHLPNQEVDAPDTSDQAVASQPEATPEPAPENAPADSVEKKEFETVTVMDRTKGMLSFLNTWFGIALKFLYEKLGNYILAILVFALAAKIILFPFSINQQKNSQKMARLAPKQEAIRKKYAGRTDRATQMKMNEEMQQLYADEKFNPMGGCLPMLLQLPIIFVLYSVITNPLSSVLGYASEQLATLSAGFTANQSLFEGIRASITETDAISLIAHNPEAAVVAFGQDITNQITGFYNSFAVSSSFNLMDKPEIASLLVLVPILVFLSSFFSTKIIRKFTYNPTANMAGQDASMKVMDWTMPLMILWFSFQVPALIGVYWIFQNIISIGQQFALSKLFPVKAPTPEEIREAELLMRGKKSSKRQTESYEAPKKPQPVKKAPIKKKKANSPFIYAKKGIDAKYLEHVKQKGKAPKAKMKP